MKEINKDDLPITLTVPEVAEILRINKSKAYELSHRDNFPAFNIGRRIVIPREAFFNWLNNTAPNMEF